MSNYKTCNTCRHYDKNYCRLREYATVPDKKACYAHLSMTNLDHIKRMTDEELVDFFMLEIAPGDVDKESFKEYWLNWLNHIYE